MLIDYIFIEIMAIPKTLLRRNLKLIKMSSKAEIQTSADFDSLVFGGKVVLSRDLQGPLEQLMERLDLEDEANSIALKIKINGKMIVAGMGGYMTDQAPEDTLLVPDWFFESLDVLPDAQADVFLLPSKPKEAVNLFFSSNFPREDYLLQLLKERLASLVYISIGDKIPFDFQGRDAFATLEHSYPIRKSLTIAKGVNNQVNGDIIID
ncbi:uncharacterized protein LOC132203497 [Neocloeon triangulifer]|uniref:uncharacterized protein LOC132203497 n=1 Tax=Neocloeon triangulifer TaxID=2078957 RepID=UPI00286F1C6A|nr:uncharacterized protein LOC132203497 [Neocloeon triangulifer]